MTPGILEMTHRNRPTGEPETSMLKRTCNLVWGVYWDCYSPSRSSYDLQKAHSR